MGILNLTPDSFSDGGTLGLMTCLKRAEGMISDGVDIIDLGGESTRPGAEKFHWKKSGDEWKSFDKDFGVKNSCFYRYYEARDYDQGCRNGGGFNK